MVRRNSPLGENSILLFIFNIYEIYLTIIYLFLYTFFYQIGKSIVKHHQKQQYSPIKQKFFKKIKKITEKCLTN